MEARRGGGLARRKPVLPRPLSGHGGGTTDRGLFEAHWRRSASPKRNCPTGTRALPRLLPDRAGNASIRHSSVRVVVRKFAVPAKVLASAHAPAKALAHPAATLTTGSPALAALGGRPLAPSALLSLQGSVGNRTVAGMLAGSRGRRSATRPPPPSAGLGDLSVQRVGGSKVGITVTARGESTRDAVSHFQAIVLKYKTEIQNFKKKADADFEGHKDDLGAQAAYSEKLKRAEVDLPELKRRINSDPLLQVGSDNVVQTRALASQPGTASPSGTGGGTSPESHFAHDLGGVEIAKLLTGGLAYFEDQGGQSSVSNISIFKKHAMGDKDKEAKEYIQVQERMLRRYAFRGITPVEMGQILAKQMVTPIFATALEAEESGVHFDEVTGLGFKRAVTKEVEGSGGARQVSNTDLGYVKDLAPNASAITPEMYAFVHARKGVGKFFSLTSTSKPITSNAGESFSRWGSVTLDLSRLDPADFVFHYAGGGADQLLSGLESLGPESQHDAQLLRGQQSLLRNREIIIKKYPASAITKRDSFTDVDHTKVLERAKDDGYFGRPKPYVFHPRAVEPYKSGYLQGTKLAQREGTADGKALKDCSSRSPIYRTAYNAGRLWRYGFNDGDRGNCKQQKHESDRNYKDGYKAGSQERWGREAKNQAARRRK